MAGVAVDLEALTGRWERRWPGSLPVGHELDERGRDVWVRFHGLPDSKRYPGDEREYAIVLERHNTVLDELFGGAELYVIIPAWTSDPPAPAARPGTTHWRTWLQTDDPDPAFRTYGHAYVEQLPWRRGCLDGLLRQVADEEVAGVIITDTDLRRIHHPYDGGADVFLTTTAERDRLKARHAGWLSRHPNGW
ncbi:hypothetical protein [Kitasatospora sp. NPDC059599]|uniref:DUF3885 domain-containing protein n=1 Tax=Kitasatospora sp. NPDC059599 TaxID=3346880 RepID=UPI00369DCB11